MEFAFDYIEDVSIPFMNFVERDMTTFVSGGSNELQLSYPQMYFNVIGKVMGYDPHSQNLLKRSETHDYFIDDDRRSLTPEGRG